MNRWNVELLLHRPNGMNRYLKRPKGVITVDFSISALFIGIWPVADQSLRTPS